VLLESPEQAARASIATTPAIAAMPR